MNRDATMDSALDGDAQQMALDDAVEVMGKLAKQVQACVEGIARLEGRPPVDLEMLERGMDQLTKALPPRQPAAAPVVPQRAWWLLPAVSTGCLLVGLVVGWQVPRWTDGATRRQVHLLEQMDAVLRQSWGTVPTGVRDTLTTLYKQAGYQPPAEPRKGK